MAIFHLGSGHATRATLRADRARPAHRRKTEDQHGDQVQRLVGEAGVDGVAVLLQRRHRCQLRGYRRRPQRTAEDTKTAGGDRIGAHLFGIAASVAVPDAQRVTCASTWGTA